ncbi:orotate phosphoribosyltransferase [Clostridium sp. D2Q-11]|uniref:Orotate phosphoribosyltransferase n=1 Tax=Anaeromonas frigoriresistens TaxID=2683708 RepID=A0A942V3C0_9FIRM|nr:orotate phosphoribosyltransferase [Anaeromonas frigoriresistens]MBS4539192.1 orotate phosphoribosyltransferase [Anaeromonas frigoriresistens]
MKSIIDILKDTEALLEGHFLLSSGKHSKEYVQCAKVLSHPQYAEQVLNPVVDKVKSLDIDILVGPAMGGIIVAYEMGRQLEKQAIFTERKDNEMTLRRGFQIEKGQRVLITEDVVTTGKSTMETKKVIESLGGIVIGVASIVDRTGGKSELDIPLYSAISLQIDTYDNENCPMCKEGKEAVKPGSRKL